MEARKQAIFRTTKGVLIAAGVTLAAMLLLAAAVVFLGISDSTLFLMNQVAKVLSIFLGAYGAVGAGGQRGFITGAGVGFLYMVVGYGCYLALNGTVNEGVIMLGEMVMGAVLGALSGAVAANMRPKKRRKMA